MRPKTKSLCHSLIAARTLSVLGQSRMSLTCATIDHMFKHFLMFNLVVPTKQRDNMERVGAPTLVYLVYS